MKTATHTATFEAAPNPKIFVETENFSVDFVDSDDNNIELSWDVDDPNSTSELKQQEVTFDFDKENNKLTVKAMHTSNQRRQPSIKLSLEIPDNSEIEAHTINGRLEMSDLKGDFRVKSANGHVELSDCKGKFDLESLNGHIRVDDSKGDITINSQNGGITLEDCGGILKVQSQNGSVKAQDSNFEKAEIETINGQIFYDFDETEKGDFNFRSKMGRIKIIIPEEKDFDIEASNSMGSIKINLDGDYDVEHSEETKNIKMIKGAGDIKIKAATKMGSIMLLNNLTDNATNITVDIDIPKHIDNGVKFASKALNKLSEKMSNFSVKKSFENLGEKIQNIRNSGDITNNLQKDLQNLASDLENLGEEIGESISDAFGGKKVVRRHKTYHPPRHPQQSHRPHPHHSHHEAPAGSNHSKIKILSLLEDGKITVEEAEKLLKALKEQ